MRRFWENRSRLCLCGTSDEAPDEVFWGRKGKGYGGEEATSNIEHSTSNVEIRRGGRGSFDPASAAGFETKFQVRGSGGVGEK